ncbi:MAG: hypothetical protein JO282_01975 [Alphaproteobacteria bacterium]|nr:hypothetical protein [Alphaproteobacteria bacterium]
MSATTFSISPQAAARFRVFEAGEGQPLVFLHGVGGLTEDSPFLAAIWSSSSGQRRWHTRSLGSSRVAAVYAP